MPDIKRARKAKQSQAVSSLAPAPLRALTETQAGLIESIKRNTITFATGPAGTGKTYLCGAMAGDAFASGQIDKIVLTRPAIEAGEHLGFLPGELDEKYRPYIEPFFDSLEDRLGLGRVEYEIKRKRILPIPLGFMRGRTLKNAWIILDEAQNTTPKQMLLFLTRIGQGSKVMITGDLDQADLLGFSGLADAVDRLGGLPDVGHVQFSIGDTVRSEIVRHILLAYQEYKPRTLRSHGPQNY